MPSKKLEPRFGLVLLSSFGLTALQIGACSPGDGGLPPATGGQSTSGGTHNSGPSTGGRDFTESGGGTLESGQGGSATPGESLSAGMGGSGGRAGLAEGGTEDTGITCVFHTPAPEAESPPAALEAAGQGGGGPQPTISLLKNGFAGMYLADSGGKALYVYGADAPGDCEHEAVTNCYDDCAIAWPPFIPQTRLLPDSLDDSLFGTIPRSDGPPQTTFRGWPLYYYKNDVGPGDVKGHAVGRIWQLAQLVLPNVVVMRVETTRFIADGEGRALYTFSDDQPGASQHPPQSACQDSCSRLFPPFGPSYLSPVTYLAATDFGYFVRQEGTQQLAYKGLPLYRFSGDERSAEMNGIFTTGFSLVTP